MSKPRLSAADLQQLVDGLDTGMISFVHKRSGEIKQLLVGVVNTRMFALALFALLGVTEPVTTLRRSSRTRSLISPKIATPKTPDYLQRQPLPDFDVDAGNDNPWLADQAAVEQAPDDYVRVYAMDSPAGYRVMERFAESLSPGPTRRRLLDALDGAKPFRNFKHRIAATGEERQRWFAFRDARTREHVREILQHDFELEAEPTAESEVKTAPANIVFIARSLDGFIAGKNGELDWLHAVPNPNGDDLGYNQLMADVDAVVMGRTTFETVLGFDGPWPYAKPVFVLSTTLTEVPAMVRDRVTLLHGTPAEVVAELHARGYPRLYIDGGTTIQGFLRADLIDELRITTLPVLLGGGFPLFGDLERPLEFDHLETVVYLDHLVQSRYRRRR